MNSLGSKQMTYGLLWLLVGALVAVALWSAAQDANGLYVVAYGAMFGGALELLIGLINYIGGAQ
jgi:uncharacterized BrkB/YihY/UPF0761 family membrane protein